MIRSGFAKVSLTVILTSGWPSALSDELPSPPRSTPPVIGFFDASKPLCLSREYDAKHMASHPKQEVTGLAFAYEPFQRFEGEPDAQPMWDQYGDTPAAFVKIVVTLKGELRPAFGSADCRAGENAATLVCGIEGDGGGFALTKQPSGKYRLDNKEGFTVEFASTNPDEPNGGLARIDPADDQDAFLLNESSGGLCDANWTDSP